MHLTHPRQVRVQRLPRRRRQHRHPILPALPLPHDDLLAIEVEILDPKLETFFETEPGAVEQHHHQPLRAGELLEERADLVSVEHYRQPFRRTRPHNRWNVADGHRQHVFIEKQQRTECLILCGGADVLVDREKRQKPRDFRDAHLGGMCLAMEEDVAADPVDVGLFGPPAVMAGTNRLAHAVEQLGSL
ncbi:MAG: hypothetical protein HYU37_09520 [Acidobacteria bacterium]|nr:hypothetical protein [Acidobacteriota bacterium]